MFFFTVCLQTLSYLLSLALICIYMYEIDHVHVHVGYVYKEVQVNTLEKHSDSGHWLFCGKMGEWQ